MMLVRNAGGAYEGTTYMDGVMEYRTDGTLGQNRIHISDDGSRVANVVLGDAFTGDLTETSWYVISDHIGCGSLRLNVASGGTLIDREEYYPFGDSSLRTVGKKRYRYVGKERDAESGLYYYGARYYAGWTCRFVSVDPLAGKFPRLTPYNNASNQPITYKDIEGLQKNGEKDDIPSSENKNDESATHSEEPGFWESFLVTAIKGLIGTYQYINNNPAHAGYSVKPQKITQEQIDAYSIDWSKQLNPYYLIESFASGVVGTVIGVYEFGEGIYEGDGAKTARALPSVFDAVATVYGLRLPTSRLARFKPKGATIKAPGKGLDIRNSTVVRDINPGTSIDEIVSEAKRLTYETGLEHALIQLEDGTRQLVSGGKHGINLPSNTDILFGHTHPAVPKGANNGPSLGDREALDHLDQSKQYIYHDGQRTTIYRGTDSSADATTTNY